MNRFIKLKNVQVENPQYSPELARAASIMAFALLCMVKLGIL